MVPYEAQPDSPAYLSLFCWRQLGDTLPHYHPKAEALIRAKNQLRLKPSTLQKPYRIILNRNKNMVWKLFHSRRDCRSRLGSGVFF